MIIKYSTGTIVDVIDPENNKEDLKDKLIEATELSEEDKLIKEAAKKQIKPFWLKK
jgi:hypothetical protein